MSENNKELRCSFCGKSEKQVHRMIQGPGVRICDECIQVLGGNGYSREFHVERFYRDAKLLEIGEGTSEIQRMVISGAVLAK